MRTIFTTAAILTLLVFASILIDITQTCGTDATCRVELGAPN